MADAAEGEEVHTEHIRIRTTSALTPALQTTTDHTPTGHEIAAEIEEESETAITEPMTAIACTSPHEAVRAQA